MAGTKLVLDVGIILRALIGVGDLQRDRRAGRDLLAGRVIDHHAGENFHRVGFLPLRGEARRAGLAAIQIDLDVLDIQRDARRAAIDHAADRNAVALAEGRHAKQMAEGVVGHGLPRCEVS